MVVKYVKIPKLEVSPDTHFDGVDYNHERDFEHQKTALTKVWELMVDGKWRSLKEISIITGSPEASASALLRDFRKKKFGSHEVLRERQQQGFYLYKLIPNQSHEEQ